MNQSSAMLEQSKWSIPQKWSSKNIELSFQKFVTQLCIKGRVSDSNNIFLWHELEYK